MEKRTGVRRSSQFVYLTNSRICDIMNELSLTRLNHGRQQEGILKIEQCTTSEQALESDSAKAKSDFETVKARQKQKNAIKVIASERS